MKRLLISLIEIYQTFFSFDKGVLSLFAPGGSCRYQVSCSEYTKQQIMEVGAIQGSLMGIKRIWSCR